jgi:hypothetical protein
MTSSVQLMAWRPAGVQNRPFLGVFSATQPHKGNRTPRLMERAMGIEPTSEAWDALNISIPFTVSISI